MGKFESEINVCGVFEHVRQKYELADPRRNVDKNEKRKTGNGKRETGKRNSEFGCVWDVCMVVYTLR
jgi:hypothetical protein